MTKQLKPLPIGAAVEIRKTSGFYEGTPPNPINHRGTVIRNDRDRDLTHRVRWDNGSINSYSRDDLKYWKGKQPVKAKTEKPKLTLAEVQEKAEKACLANGVNCCARFALIDEGAGKYSVNTNTACHSQVLSRSFGALSNPTHITTALHPKSMTGLTDKVAKVAYFHWLFIESPWAPAFVEKDAQACVERGFVLCTTKVSGPILQGGLIATRQPYEHTSRIVAFKKWLDEGVDGNTAFMMASCLQIEGSNVVLGTHSGGHYPICPGNMGKEGITNFVSGWVPKLPAKTYYQGGNASGVHALFGESDDGREHIKDILKASQKGDAKVRNTNPFAKALDTEINTFDYKKLVEYVLDKGFKL